MLHIWNRPSVTAKSFPPSRSATLPASAAPLDYTPSSGHLFELVCLCLHFAFRVPLVRADVRLLAGHKMRGQGRNALRREKLLGSPRSVSHAAREQRFHAFDGHRLGLGHPNVGEDSARQLCAFFRVSSRSCGAEHREEEEDSVWTHRRGDHVREGQSEDELSISERS